MMERALTVRQPWADLIMADDGAGGCLKPVENRTWPVPSTLPQWKACARCGGRWEPDGSKVWPLPGGITCGDAWDAPCKVYDDSPFPFRLWIHAGQRGDESATAQPAWWEAIRADLTPGLRRGMLLGSVLVTGCHHANECLGEPSVMTSAFGRPCSRWAEPDTWHWTLTDPQPLDAPIPMRGRQGLWMVNAPEMARFTTTGRQPA